MSSSSSDADIITSWYSDDSLLTRNQNAITIGATGKIRYTVWDANNGCEASDSIEIRIAQNPLTGIDYSVINESCLGSDDGMLGMINAQGGEGNIVITIDGGIVSETFIDATVGTHNISAIDDFGCVIIDSFNILEGVDFSVNIPNQVSVFRGETRLIYS